jgi:ubiquitin-protein ligase
MSKIEVTIQDVTKSRQGYFTMRPGTPDQDLIERAVRLWRLPLSGPFGTPIRYCLLDDGNVKALVPAFTAGAGNARLRRLAADYEKIKNQFTGHPHIHVEPLFGNPPERYRVVFSLRGIQELDYRHRPVYLDRHEAEIYLHMGYPREKPKCVLRTEIFHPNFGPYICIGDHWAAGETLADVIVQIGQMLAYQSYNPKSPLNGLAAQWARQNEHLFPVDSVNLYQAEPEISFGPMVDRAELEEDLDISFTSSPQEKEPDNNLEIDLF